jgi:hypothetical protein
MPSEKKKEIAPNAQEILSRVHNSANPGIEAVEKMASGHPDC